MEPKVRVPMRYHSARVISMKDLLMVMITKVMMMLRIHKRGIKRGKLRFGVGRREEMTQIRENQDQDHR